MVTKANGKNEAFSKWKVVRTCLRLGATQETAKTIADEIESRLYEGITTRTILQMIYRRLKKRKPVMKLQTDLRRSLSLLRSAPDFEQYIHILLAEHGYEVTPNQIIRGKCVEHEVDAIAQKNGKTCIVEVKHHYKYHTPTSLDVTRISRAVFEDLTEGHQLGHNNLKIDYAMIVCNTKLSEHAKRYANCRNIKHISWSSPPKQDLQTMIETKKLYPITILKGLNTNTLNKLTSNKIIMLKQLTERTIPDLRRQTVIPKEKLRSMVDSAKAILSGK